MLELIWLIPVLPLAGFLINGLFGKKLSKTAVGVIGSTAILAAFIISLGVFSTISSGETKSITVHLFDWINVGFLKVPFEFLVDPLTCIMLLVITGVGFLIHVYSTGYMHHDEGFYKFFAYLNLFVFFMLLLVLGANYLILFIGWEGVGLCSYLLIGFWYKNNDYNYAARKAFVMNRIGDLGFLLALFFIFDTFGSLSFADVFSGAASMNSGDMILTTITLLLFVGACGKSAQLPLYTWLPDAMAGPTPVSALIHAATMVTAGIYMIARSGILYALSPVALSVVAVVGTITAIWAALIALTQNDIKKVLAYSTVSQLGYMFVALGAGSFSSGVFHLMTHAFFKALLFLGAGSVIHAMSDEQDLRKMGGLRKALPVTFLTFLIGTIAISGIPPFSGFFSKDEILAVTYGHSPVLFYVLSITSILTAFYMFRLLFLAFYGSFRGTTEQEKHLHESPKSMTIPLILLAFLSAVGGLVGLPELFSEHHSLKEFLNPVFEASEKIMGEHQVSHGLEWAIIISALVTIPLIVIATWRLYSGKNYTPTADADLSTLKRISYNKFYVDEVYDFLFAKPLAALSGIFHRFVEVMGIDGLVNATGRLTIGASKRIRLAQTGNIGFYIFAMVLGIIAIMAYSFLMI